MTGMALLILVLMLGLLFLGFPMKVPLLVSSLAVLAVYFPSVDGAVVIQQAIGGIKPAALLAVPMFIFDEFLISWCMD